MKPLFTAAALAISVAASAPAFAETVFAEGVWNGDRLEFYDSRLNDSGYFASLRRSGWGQIFEMEKGIPFISNVSNVNVSTGSVQYQYRVGSGVTGYNNEMNYYEKYYSYDLRRSIYDIKELEEAYERHNIIFDETGFPNSYDEYYHETWAGGYIHTNDPEVARSTLSTALSTIPFDGVGIFDFEQSFIHYSDYSGDYSISLADSLRGGAWDLNCDACSPEYWPSGYAEFYYYAGEFLSFFGPAYNSGLYAEWGNSWGSPYSNYITGMTLAYNLPAVPEPETWAMLLAGLGIVGAVAKRRRQG
ncbi:MAG: PEPxxWA-CTERM sorting domain-containing protein [Azoarcus sp.]|jgi:hypothetical protein|nr:PEPxxWA-CTERM sorting domain-containing protein [Azoarcus sp.]